MANDICHDFLCSGSVAAQIIRDRYLDFRPKYFVVDNLINPPVSPPFKELLVLTEDIMDHIDSTHKCRLSDKSLEELSELFDAHPGRNGSDRILKAIENGHLFNI